MIKRYVSRLQDKSDALHCMALSTRTLTLLLPSVAIAEIYNAPPVIAQGLYQWRETTIPFFSMEQLLSQPESELPFQHTAILHRLNNSKDASFWAIGLTALPKVIRVEHGDLDLEKEQTIPHCIAVRINQGSLLIPDLQAIENTL